MAQATISITVNGEAKEVEATTTGVELFAEDKNIVAVKLNGENRDLYTPLADGDTVEPITLDSEDGLAIMRHSATHVMAQAVQEVYPNAKLGAELAVVSLGGFLQTGLVCLEIFLAGPSGAVDALHGRVLLAATPVGSG